MPTIGVMTAYRLPPADQGPAPTLRGLTFALSRYGLEVGGDVQLHLSESNSLEVQYQVTMRWLDQGVDLIFAGGTPLVGVLRQAFSARGQSRPVVYYGAHPESGGEPVALRACLAPDTACVRIELPLTYHHRNFRLLRALFPSLARVHIPFSRCTVFCYPAMAERYDRLTRERGPHAWAIDEEVGFPAIRNLCWIIDATYREYPLRDADHLATALCSIPRRAPGAPVTDVVVSFNDTFHVAGAPETLLEFSRVSGVPLIWVNNPEMAHRGAVADFCNPFEVVAQHAGEHVARYLTGRWDPGTSHVEWNHDVVFTLNRAFAQELGIPTDSWGAAAKHFHQVLDEPR